MRTAEAVVDGKMTDGALGSLYRRVHEFKRRIEEGIPFDVAMYWMQRLIEGRLLPTWKKIRLDHGNPYFRAIIANRSPLAGWIIEDSVYELLNQAVWSDMSATELVTLTIHELGSPENFKEIKKAALRFGLCFCPPEMALRLRFYYRDQPIRERLVLAMDPLTHPTSPTRKFVFYLDRSQMGALVLGVEEAKSLGRKLGYFRPTTRMVFIRISGV